MICSPNATAWALIGQLWGRDGPISESALSESERSVLGLLSDLKAVKAHKTDLRYLLCPYCQLYRGPVGQGKSGLLCQCPDCGSVPVDLSDTRAWMLDSDWLIRKLRGALDVPPQQTAASVTSGIWRLGTSQLRPVILARSLDLALQQPTAVARANSRSTHPPWLITPRPLRDVESDPFSGSVVWLPLEERFVLYGGNLQCIEPSTPLDSAGAAMQAVNGPFSADFRWAHLAAWPQGPIMLTEAQAAVFKALWHFRGLAQLAEAIMAKAGLGSTKPIDVFKVKKQNKGDPRYEGPLHVYQSLVTTDRRAGTYAMSCAGT